MAKRNDTGASGGTVKIMPTPQQPESPKGPRWEAKPEADKEAKKAEAKGQSAGKE